ncbi:hypothetical protein [Amnibacterium endophyticum]|uniref:Uncharacterized protein n=1 Tax=Amnibacterium endophyticum TaxID=2109337 RepID=A0ABW4LGB5_9MICO
MPPVARSPLTALVAVLVGLGLAKGLARVAGLGVLLVVVLSCVGALTVGVALLRLLVLT